MAPDARRIQSQPRKNLVNLVQPKFAWAFALALRGAIPAAPTPLEQDLGAMRRSPVAEPMGGGDDVAAASP